MNTFGLILGTMVVLLSAKPNVLKARNQVRETKNTVTSLRNRRFMLSQKIRSLARESLGQRMTAGQDDEDSSDINIRIASVKRKVEELEAIDRRVLVFDERRGLTETGWILQLRRSRDAAPAMEPAAVGKLWEEGRFIFCFAGDSRRARRKILVRFPEEQGYEVLEILPHEGDMTEPPDIGMGAPSKA